MTVVVLFRIQPILIREGRSDTAARGWRPSDLFDFLRPNNTLPELTLFGERGPAGGESLSRIDTHPHQAIASAKRTRTMGSAKNLRAHLYAGTTIFFNRNKSIPCRLIR